MKMLTDIRTDQTTDQQQQWLCRQFFTTAAVTLSTIMTNGKTLVKATELNKKKHQKNLYV